MIDIEIGREVGLNYATKDPKCIFFILENTHKPEDQEVHSLDIAHCRISPNVALQHSLDGGLHIICEVFFLKGPVHILVYLSEHWVRILVAFLCHYFLKSLVVVLTVATLVIPVTLASAARFPELGSASFGREYTFYDEIIKVFPLELSKDGHTL